MPSGKGSVSSQHSGDRDKHPYAQGRRGTEYELERADIAEREPCGRKTCR